MSVSNADRLLTVKELCDILQTTRRNIELLRKQGMPYYLLGNAPRFDLDEVRQWMRQNALQQVQLRNNSEDYIFE